METKNKFIRKSTVEKYFKALQQLYYRIVVLKETDLSLNKFTTENNLANSTSQSFLQLGILENTNTILKPHLIWIEQKPTKLMAEKIVRYNKEKIIKSQKSKSDLYIEMLDMLKNLNNYLNKNINLESKKLEDLIKEAEFLK